MAESTPKRIKRRVTLVFALAIGLPALALSYLGLQSIEADRQAAQSLGRERLDQAARALAVAIEDEVRGRAEAALHALRPTLQAERVRAATEARAGGRAASAHIEGLAGDVAIAREREPLLKGLLVAQPTGRLLYPRARPADPLAAAAPADRLERWLEDGRAAEARGGLKAAIARFEARAELRQALAQAALGEARGGREAARARQALREVAADPRDPESAARARLAIARGLDHAGDRAAAIAELDLLGLVDPELATEGGLSIACAARLRAAELRLLGQDEAERARAVDALGRLAADLAGDHPPLSAAEARLFEERLGAAEAGARLDALARALAGRDAEDAYARELALAVLPELVAAARVSPPRPGEVALLSVTPRRGEGGAARFVAYRVVPADEDGAGGGGPAEPGPAEGAARSALLVALDLDLARAAESVVAPWAERIALDRGAALAVRGPDRRVLAAAGEPEPGAATASGDGAPAARVRLERLLPFWTVEARPARGGAEEARVRLRLLLQGGMVALLLAAVLLGALWTLRALGHSLELAELKADFVANVSHELRTPLTSIKLYADLLRSGRARTDERRARCLDTIAQETARLEALIDGLLAFTRHEQGRSDYRFEPVRPAEVALAALEEMRPQLGAAGFAVDVAVEGEDALPLVRADRAALGTALKNLIQNAIKYSPPERAFVELRVRAVKGGAAIAVRDRGVGIAPEERAHLFERFWRGESARRLARPGSGLGLALVQRVAEDHGGRVEVDSTPGEGSTFTVWLPAAKAE